MPRKLSLVAPSAAAVPVFNKHGQTLGGKGRRSRERIIAETVDLLRDRPVNEVTMVAIVARAGVTKAAFYLYFDDVAEVVLAALEQTTREFEQLVGYVNRPWPADRLFESALEFVSVYFAIWKRHSAILRARNLLADSGDERFVAHRIESSVHISAALAEKLGATPRRDDVSPRLLANVLLIAVERSATVTALELYGNSGGSVETARTLAHLLELALQTTPVEPA